MSIHKPVLLKETINLLKLKPGMIVVDATLGGGGHSLAILEKILPEGRLIAIDQDELAIRNFKNNLADINIEPKTENVKLINGNFSELKNIAETLKINCVDAVIADLGISSDQLENEKRGFSFQKDGDLDMRMDKKAELTAHDVVNNYSEVNLKKVLTRFGEEKYATKIAKAIASYRKNKPIESTKELVEIIRQSVPEFYQHKRIHFATRTFQAFRMEVNQELENLEKFLLQAIEMLKKGGRLAVISFHSGEDRIVKRIFRENARGCICPTEFPVCRCGKLPKIKIISRKPIVPNSREIKENPRSRSAKLRVIEKI